MKFLRVAACAAIVGGLTWLAVRPAAAEDVKVELAQVGAELERAAHTDPGHQAGAPDPLSVDPDLALWTLVVFVLLLLVLTKFAWRPILDALERREHAVADHIAQAERTHEQARQLLVEYEQKLAGAANQVRELLDEARRDAEHTKQEILAEAKKGAEAERARALRDIEAAADAAMESLARRSSDLAIELAGKIVQAQLSKADHARLIQDAMKKFPAGAGTN